MNALPSFGMYNVDYAVVSLISALTCPDYVSSMYAIVLVDLYM